MKIDIESAKSDAVIPYGRQHVSQCDIDAVIDVLRSDFLTQGPVVPAFETAIASYCDARHAVAVSNATSALHIACLALGVGKGDTVWTSPITFVATANCALMCGATVDFVDIDAQTCNMSVERLAEKLESAKTEGKLPQVVIPVHLSGQACDMAGIHELSVQYGFKVIEDASHAIGAQYKNRPVGNCHYSDITVFSFHPVKIITTGEGGVATTNNALLAHEMNLLRSHGITRDAADMTRESDGPWYYQQICLGYNYRMTDIQAALGLSQLQRLDEFVTARHAIATRYDTLLSEFPVILPRQDPDSYSSMHLYIIRLCPLEIKLTHRQVFECLREKGIGVNIHYIPVHTQPFYQQMGFRPGDFPEANNHYATSMSLPLFPGLSETEQNKVVEAVAAATDT